MNKESIAMIPRNQPFDVGPFSTEWDQWCDHRVPFINEKFGSRPCVRALNSTHWWQWNEQLIDRTVRENPVIYLRYGCFDSHIKLLFEACRKVNEPRLIVSDVNIRSAKPANVRVIYTEPTAYQFSYTFANADIKPIYHRKIQDFKHPFMIMARNVDHGRSRLMLMLKQLGLLEDALYSCGNITAADYLFMEDPRSINSCLSDMVLSVLGGQYIKFDVKKNLKVIPELINRCHFYVSADSNGLFKEAPLYSVGEKTLWGYATTVPVLPIWYNSIDYQMQDWGYRFQNIPYRQPGETQQDTVVRWCQEILFRYQITQNSQWAQSWQDKQGEDTIHNFELTLGLYKTIARDIERQIDELPQEFQNL